MYFVQPTRLTFQLYTQLTVSREEVWGCPSGPVTVLPVSGNPSTGGRGREGGEGQTEEGESQGAAAQNEPEEERGEGEDRKLCKVEPLSKDTSEMATHPLIRSS